MKAAQPLFAVSGDALFGSVAPAFGLAHEEQFDDLWDLLFAYSCRDQEGEPKQQRDARALSERRLEGHRLAKVMRDQAASMLASLELMHASKIKFEEEVIKWNPPLMEAIFDIDLSNPRSIFLPDTISILLTFFEGIDWDVIDGKLADMAALPVKEKLDRGPVANTTLRGALRGCRTYWRDVEGKSWSMSALKTNGARYDNMPDRLAGECEIFVACMLERAHLRFDLRSLSSAWVAIDRDT